MGDNLRMPFDRDATSEEKQFVNEALTGANGARIYTGTSNGTPFGDQVRSQASPTGNLDVPCSQQIEMDVRLMGRYGYRVSEGPIEENVLLLGPDVANPRKSTVRRYIINRVIVSPEGNQFIRRDRIDIVNSAVVVFRGHERSEINVSYEIIHCFRELVGSFRADGIFSVNLLESQLGQTERHIRSRIISSEFEEYVEGLLWMLKLIESYRNAVNQKDIYTIKNSIITLEEFPYVDVINQAICLLDTYDNLTVKKQMEIIERTNKLEEMIHGINRELSELRQSWIDGADDEDVKLFFRTP